MPARACTGPRPGTSCAQLAELLAIAGLHQPRGQERVPRDPSARARLRRRSRCRRPVHHFLRQGRPDLRHRLQLHRDQLRRRRCRRARRSSTPPSTRWTSTRTCACALGAARRCQADAGGAASTSMRRRRGTEPARSGAGGARDRRGRASPGSSSGCRSSTSDDAPLNPYRVLWDLQHTVDVANTIITHDAGSPRDQLSPFWGATTPLSYHRLGQDHAARLRARPRHGRQARAARTSSASTSGATPRSASPAWTSRPRCASASRSSRSCSTTSRMAIELKVMPVSTEKYRSTDISGDYAALARAFGGYGERVDRARRDRAGDPARHRGDRARPAGAARVHHHEGGRGLAAGLRPASASI